MLVTVWRVIDSGEDAAERYSICLDLLDGFDYDDSMSVFVSGDGKEYSYAFNEFIDQDEDDVEMSFYDLPENVRERVREAVAQVMSDYNVSDYCFEG